MTEEELRRAIERDHLQKHGSANQHSPSSQRALLLKHKWAGFLAWLGEHGCEIAFPASKWEVLRYRAKTVGGTGTSKKGKMVWHIIHTNKDGRLTFGTDSSYHFSLFIAGLPFPVIHTKAELHAEKKRNAKTRISWTKKMRAALIERNGSDCWFCHQPLGEDITIEHMLARHLGGDDHIDNLVLAHADCNRKAGHKTIAEKQAIREYYRKGLHTNVPHWNDPPVRVRKGKKP